MIKFDSLAHINIIVDDIEAATNFYVEVFNATPVQDFPNFKNVGFAKSAGFLENPNEVDVTIRIIKFPTNDNLLLELMEYHYPTGPIVCSRKVANGRGCVGHVALGVSNIDEAFHFLKTIDGVTMINQSPEYKPFKLDPIQLSEFKFFDSEMEADAKNKEDMCTAVGNISYFYFLDPYGVQWELVQS